MNLNSVREKYYKLSEKTSDISRQLGFAGIAIIWIFKTSVYSTTNLPFQLQWAGLLLVIALSFDFLHYLSATTIWGVFGRFKEIKLADKREEFDAPAWFNWPALSLFCLKAGAIIIAYGFLLHFLFVTLYSDTTMAPSTSS